MKRVIDFTKPIVRPGFTHRNLEVVKDLGENVEFRYVVRIKPIDGKNRNGKRVSLLNQYGKDAAGEFLARNVDTPKAGHVHDNLGLDRRMGPKKTVGDVFNEIKIDLSDIKKQITELRSYWQGDDTSTNL